jgi:imidazolonepropionase-like amidohydrolase
MRIRNGGFFDTITGDIVPGKDIFVDKEVISDIREAEGNLDKDDLDLSEYFLFPGFVDAHNHLCFDIGDEVNQIAEPLGYQSLVAAKNARKAISSGVTLLRDAGEKEFVDLSLKRGINAGLILGPRLLVAGPGLMRTGGHMWFMGYEIDGEAEAQKGVRIHLKANVDYIKIFVSGGATSHYTDILTPELSKKEIEAIIGEAHMAGKKVGAHTHGGPAATWAIESGVDAIEHGCFLTEEQLQLMVKHGTFLVSTIGVQRAIRDHEANPEFFKAKAGRAYENHLDVVRRAIDLGIKIAVGNDTNHGCIVEEIEFLVKAGMPVSEAIKAATIGGATLCSLDSITGSIEIGKYADLIAFKADPLKDTSVLKSVEWVLKSGEVCKNPNGLLLRF